MAHLVRSVRTKGNFTVEAVFLDGTVKTYDIEKLFDSIPQFRIFESDKKLFRKVCVDTGGYGISWNDILDLDADTIWEYGTIVDKIAVGPGLDVAFRLSEARIKAGITQKQLAEKTGLYQSDISKIERGLANPSVSTLVRLAEGLGMKLEIRFL